MTLTQRDNGNRVREPPQGKTAFGRVPLLLTWDKMGHTGQAWDTLCDRVAVRDLQPMVTESKIRAVMSFVHDHGYVQYRDGLEARYPRLKLCEVCRSRNHAAYVFDHCHDHGWVRGILCGLCNSQMRLIDRGRLEIPHYVEHRRKCPDCRKNRKPRVRPVSCWSCSGGFLWLATLGRMSKCPICRGAGIVTPGGSR